MMKLVKYAIAALAAVLLAPGSHAELGPCNREGFPKGSLCGSIPVPASYDDPDAGMVSLDVVVLAARGEVRKPDPVFYLAGGPGIAATGSAGFFARNLTTMQQSRDFVLVDLRGTGRAAADCQLTAREKRDLIYSFREPPSFERCVADEEFRASLRTTVFARDLDQVRQALGAEQVNLLSASYGTRLALTYARFFPNRVRTSVLRGVASPGDVIPHLVLQGARAELERLEKAHPGLTRKYATLVASLDAKPTTVTLDGAGEIVVDGLTFEGAVRFLLYDAGTARSLPGLVDATSAGALEPLARVLAGAEPIVGSFSIPVLLGVICAEDVPFWQDGGLKGPFAPSVIRDGARATCKAWSVPAVTGSFREAIDVSATTLLLSGERDPATPPVVAERVAGELKNALHLVTPGAGHLPTWTSCYSAIIAAFFDKGGFDGLDVSCAGVPPGR